METKRQTLTRKEKNLITAKRIYRMKKEERANLEQENEELMMNQMRLLEVMDFLRSKVKEAEWILQEHQHNKNCHMQAAARKEHHPKRKWNESYHNELNAKQQQQQQQQQEQPHHHPKLRAKLGENQSLSVY